MGPGFCSLYRKIHYIEVRYIKVWVYMDFHIPKIWQILKHFSSKKNVISEEWIVVLILDLTKKKWTSYAKETEKRKRLVEYKCVLLYRFIYADKEIHLHSASYFIMFQLFLYTQFDKVFLSYANIFILKFLFKKSEWIHTES